MFLAPPCLCAFARAVPITRNTLLSSPGWDPQPPPPPSRNIFPIIWGSH